MAQLVEQRPYKAKVGSSSLSGSTEVFRSTPVYGALLAVWGIWEMRPDSAWARREPITP